MSVFARNPEPTADEHILRVLFISQLAIFPKLIVHDLTQVSAKLLCDLVQKLLHVLIVHRVCRVSGSAPWFHSPECWEVGTGLWKSPFTCLFAPLSGKVDSGLQGWPNVWARLASLAAWALTLNCLWLSSLPPPAGRERSSFSPTYVPEGGKGQRRQMPP